MTVCKDEKLTDVEYFLRRLYNTPEQLATGNVNNDLEMFLQTMHAFEREQYVPTTRLSTGCRQTCNMFICYRHLQMTSRS